MKILKIRFENIHSLKGEHQINFGEGILADAGLFAITGPTGAGKSTLLDVITLALYNRIARVDKTVSNSILEDDGGIMTRNMKSCFAEVEYRVNGKEYRSYWSIERNRNNNLNARKQELVEVATNTILETGTKTPEKNQDIIGLSYEQFVKAMVLSQGEFSKLLQAPRNERNKLLEDITGARLYREIGRAVFLRFKGIEKNIELKEAGLSGIELLPEDIVAEKKTELEALTKVKPDIEKNYASALERINTRKELQLKLEEQKKLQASILKLNEEYKTFEPYKVQLDTHDSLSKYTNNLRDFDAVEKEFDQLEVSINKLSETKKEAEAQQKSYLQTVSELVKEEVTTADATEKLEAFRKKIADLQSEENNKIAQANLLQKQVNAYVENINVLNYRLVRAENPSQFKPEMASLSVKLQQDTESSGVDSMEALNHELETSRLQQEKAGELISKKEQWLKLHKNFETQNSRFKTLQDSVENDSKAIKNLEMEVPSLEKEVENLQKILEHQRKHQSLDAYRQQLKPDEACPLCGSLEHPYVSEEPYFDAKEEILKGKKDSLKAKTEHLVSLKGKNKLQSENIEVLKAEIKTTTSEIDQTKNHIQSLADQLKWNAEDDLESFQNRRTQLNAFIQKLEKSKQAFQAAAILKDLEASFSQWEQSQQAYISLKQKRTHLCAEQDIDKRANLLSTQISSCAANIDATKKQLKEYSQKLEIASKEKLKNKNALKSILEKENLENIEALRAAILPEERAKRIRERENELKDQKVRISEKENTLEKAIIELSKKDNPEHTLEALTNFFEEANKQREELLMNLGKLTQSLADDEKAKERQKHILDKINELKKDLALWKSMNDLIGDATGNKFSNFVQDLTLEQLIGFANKRLLEFTDRYLLDIPTANEAEKSDTLKIFDKYMGNARRSVKTLSGGETFLVSLAMAFALSDIAARNVKIESLFIDEGFGTLDPETLDQAITILEKMQNEGDKSVGVISHVGALKERINTQIKLEKGSLGYSTLEVVS